MKSINTKTNSSTNQNKTDQPFFATKNRSNFFQQDPSPSFFKSTSPFNVNDESVLQTKLTIGEPNDKYEQEADAMADKVVQRLAAPEPLTKKDASVQTKPLAATVTPLIQTKCATCEQEEKLQMKEEDDLIQESSIGLRKKPIFESNAEPPDDDNNIQRTCAECEKDKEQKLQTKNESYAVQTASSSIESNLKASKGGGGPLSDSTRTQMESSFGADFSNVRIHNDSSAVQMNKNLNAQAFTHGSDIYFNTGKYDANSNSGKHLLAHELTHVIQQGGASGIVQRTVHGGTAPVPTDCHNWKIPLPPWIAGTFAHSQVAAFFAAMGVTPRMIPRAIKLLPCTNIPLPRPFGTPPGYADLWLRKPGSVDIAEIKSTASGDSCARPEAAHYRDRHNEWAARSLTHPLALDDALYSRVVGPAVPGGLLDLSSITGSDLPLGPFSADPLKILHVEADPLGSVVYWCTGIGLVNPAWLLALKALLDRLKRLMEDMKREWDRLQPVLEGIAAAFAFALKVLLVILLIIALLALIVVIVACAILEVPTAGLATLCEVPAIAGAAAVVAAIIESVGVLAPTFASVVAIFFASKASSSNQRENGQEYEQGLGNDPSASATGGAGTTAAVNPGESLAQLVENIASSISVGSLSTIASNIGSLPARAPGLLNRAANALDATGDPGTAGFIRAGLNEVSSA
jgi:hypothetical protein